MFLTGMRDVTGELLAVLLHLMHLLLIDEHFLGHLSPHLALAPQTLEQAPRRRVSLHRVPLLLVVPARLAFRGRQRDGG